MNQSEMPLNIDDDLLSKLSSLSISQGPATPQSNEPLSATALPEPIEVEPTKIVGGLIVVEDQFLDDEERREFYRIECIDDGSFRSFVIENLDGKTPTQSEEEEVPEWECKSQLLHLINLALQIVENRPDRSDMEELESLLSKAQKHAIRLNQLCVCSNNQISLVLYAPSTAPSHDRTPLGLACCSASLSVPPARLLRSSQQPRMPHATCLYSSHADPALTPTTGYSPTPVEPEDRPPSYPHCQPAQQQCDRATVPRNRSSQALGQQRGLLCEWRGIYVKLSIKSYAA